MIVTGWNNGKRRPNGSGYGIKINAKDRDEYFKRDWGNVILELAGEANAIIVNIDKPSFWDTTCRELIDKDLGVWLIKNRKAPWTKGYPPKMMMKHIGNNRFRVDLM